MSAQGRGGEFALGVCVWIVWAFVIAQLMSGYDKEVRLIVATAASVLTIYLFNRFAPKKPD